MNEEKALLVSSIPDKIWNKYHLELSNSGDFIWYGKRLRMHFSTSALYYVHIFDHAVYVNNKGGFVIFYFKGNQVDFFYH